MRGLLGLWLTRLAAVWVVCGATVASAQTEPITLVVMDPLAAPLSCPCVEGYAQREYQALADWVSQKTGRQVRIGFGESLSRGQESAGGFEADVVIGKDSVVRADAAKLGVGMEPIARLTGRKGKMTQTGLIVVRSDDPAQSVGDLVGYQIYFGPSECDEKHSAPLSLLASAGAAPPLGTELLISNACSDGATKVVDLGPSVRSAAVISSYAKPLLTGCGTIQEGDLRVVGETDPLPFVTAFISERADPETRAKIAEALFTVMTDAETLKALESMVGFLPVDEAYHELVERTSAPSRGPSPDDNTSWPGWGGPNGNGVVGWMPDRFDAEPEVVWRESLLRPGLGGVAVADGKVVVGDRDLSNQFDLWRCYDAQTGELVWRRQYPAPGALDYDNSPRATPVIRDGRAYLLGAFGDLTCVRLETGSVVWRRNLLREYGAKEQLVWGFCSSPLLVDGRLIVNPGSSEAAWVALDPQSGRELWRAAGDRRAFASPVCLKLGGVKQLVAYDRSTLGGWRIDNGERLWTMRPERKGDFNVPTPVEVGGRLFVTTENNGARLYSFDENGKVDQASNGYRSLSPDTSSPLSFEGRVYCVWNDLYCLDARGELRESWVASDDALPETGSVLAGKTSEGAARLLVTGRGGELLLIDPDAQSGERIVSRLNLFGEDPMDAEDLLTLPALVGDRLYLRGESELVCVRLGAG